MARKKVIQICPHERNRVTVLQDNVHAYIEWLRRDAFPEYDYLKLAEIADIIGVNRGLLREVMAYKVRPKNRKGRRARVPKRIIEGLIELYDKIESGKQEMRYRFDDDAKKELRELLNQMAEDVMIKFRKSFTVKQIERVAGIKNGRLEKIFVKGQQRTLTTTEMDQILALCEQIEDGTLAFTEKRLFQGNNDIRDENEFRIIVTQDDITMFEWLRENSNFTYRGLEEVLGLPQGKLSSLSAEVKRPSRQMGKKGMWKHSPRLDVDALFGLITLIERKIQELNAEYDSLGSEIEPDDALEAAVAQIPEIKQKLDSLKPPVLRERRRKAAAA